MTPMLCQPSGVQAQKAFRAPIGSISGRSEWTKIVPEVPIEQHTLAGRDDPGADGGTGIVAAAGDHRDALRQAGGPAAPAG